METNSFGKLTQESELIVLVDYQEGVDLSGKKRKIGTMHELTSEEELRFMNEYLSETISPEYALAVDTALNLASKPLYNGHGTWDAINKTNELAIPYLNVRDNSRRIVVRHVHNLLRDVARSTKCSSFGF